MRFKNKTSLYLWVIAVTIILTCAIGTVLIAIQDPSSPVNKDSFVPYHFTWAYEKETVGESYEVISISQSSKTHLFTDPTPGDKVSICFIQNSTPSYLSELYIWSDYPQDLPGPDYSMSGPSSQSFIQYHPENYTPNAGSIRYTSAETYPEENIFLEQQALKIGLTGLMGPLSTEDVLVNYEVEWSNPSILTDTKIDLIKIRIGGTSYIQKDFIIYDTLSSKEHGLIERTPIITQYTLYLSKKDYASIDWSCL